MPVRRNKRLTVDAGAFGIGDYNVSGVQIVVGSSSEAEIVNAALEAVGYTAPPR